LPRSREEYVLSYLNKQEKKLTTLKEKLEEILTDLTFELEFLRKTRLSLSIGPFVKSQ